VRVEARGSPRRAECADAFDQLRVRTCKERELGLTKVHNLLASGELPELGAAYGALNDAVCAAYGFPPATWRDEGKTLQRLLDLNRKVAGRALAE
jgi:hypothetical protein